MQCKKAPRKASPALHAEISSITLKALIRMRSNNYSVIWVAIIKKESEISYYCRLDNGLHLYGGWFYFKGRFIGPDCSVQDSDGKGTGFLEISENFEMGLNYGNFMSFFENPEDLIQLEFSARVPWIIDQALEPE